MDAVLTRSARAIYAIPLCALLALSVVFALEPADRTTLAIAAVFGVSAVAAYLLVTAFDHLFVPESAATTRVVDASYAAGWAVVVYGPFFIVGAILTFWAVGTVAGEPARWHRAAGIAGGLASLGVGVAMLRGFGDGGQRRAT